MEINSYKLKLYSHVKYLEILIDEVLSWIKQIESICAKLANSNGILSKLRHFVPKDISSRYIIPYFILIFFTVVWFGPILEKAILIVQLSCKEVTFELLILLSLISALILCFQD